MPSVSVQRPEHAQRAPERPGRAPRARELELLFCERDRLRAATQPVERLRFQRTPRADRRVANVREPALERVRRRQRLLRVPFRDEQLQHGDVPEPHGLGAHLAEDRPRRGAFLAKVVEHEASAVEIAALHVDRRRAASSGRSADRATTPVPPCLEPCFELLMPVVELPAPVQRPPAVDVDRGERESDRRA